MDRQKWVEAALDEIARVGVTRLAVEPLAKSLGTTKGSFYWHFADRSELLDAALEHWEMIATRQVVEDVSGQSVRERPEALVEMVFAPHDSDRAEWMILAAADDETVRPVVQRVHAARLAFVEDLCRGAGWGQERASARARLAYATYLGQLHLRMGAGIDSLPIDEVVSVLTSP
ncbi:TetR/AcrR family transcriptional regulator [Ornithinimicrobium faecis]|uniref:TetR/AcrR family transcriptional regulator n=1 Tax=Ornithinimicrobium faecis TaxID=2934158 RepID=UPI0021192BEA|nr:TetR/AcrR family transcriptional regulator [Ornithinimicrobium sp. HY1745]